MGENTFVFLCSLTLFRRCAVLPTTATLCFSASLTPYIHGKILAVFFLLAEQTTTMMTIKSQIGDSVVLSPSLLAHKANMRTAGTVVLTRERSRLINSRVGIRACEHKCSLFRSTWMLDAVVCRSALSLSVCSLEKPKINCHLGGFSLIVYLCLRFPRTL